MYIDIKKSKKEFLKYVNNYNMKIPEMQRKREHSIRVMEVSEKLAQNLNLSEEKIQVAALIGLLHDIGRFEQFKRYGTFKDAKSIDHGNLGVEILFKGEEPFIRKFIEDPKYDNIIKIAIKNHNKFKIEDGLNEEELLFSKMIRDADKIDIFYEGVIIFWNEEGERENINNSIASEKIMEKIRKGSLIDRKDIITPLDGLMSYFGFLFDLNFEYSIKLVKKEQYVEKILNKFDFSTNKKAEKQIQEFLSRKGKNEANYN